eukprot:6209935-Pleurochrysis_carterae.AAC.4
MGVVVEETVRTSHRLPECAVRAYTWVAVSNWQPAPSELFAFSDLLGPAQGGLVDMQLPEVPSTTWMRVQKAGLSMMVKCGQP